MPTLSELAQKANIQITTTTPSFASSTRQPTAQPLGRTKTPTSLSQLAQRAGVELQKAEPKIVEKPISPLDRSIDVTEKISRTLLPKSAEGFAETIGTALSSRFVNKLQDEVNKRGLELQPQVLERLRNPDISVEQKKKLVRVAGLDTPEIISEIEAFDKSVKDISAEALGTLGVAGLPATAPGGALGRVTMAATFGAGSATKRSLQKDEGFMDTATKAVKGAAVGATVGILFEGAGALLRKFGTKQIGKNTFNKVLQPKSKDLEQAIKFNAKTLGEKVREQVDDAGNFVYQGGVENMKKIADNQLKLKGDQLKVALRVLDDADDFTASREALKKSVEETLKKNYITLSKSDMAKVDALIKSELPEKLSRVGLQEAKLKITRGIPDSAFSKVDKNVAFATEAKMALRKAVKEAIEKSTDDVNVQQLNQAMGLAIEVREAASKVIARLAKKQAGSHFGPLGDLYVKALRELVFNPQVTTRVSQTAQQGFGVTGTIGQAISRGLSALSGKFLNR